MDSYFDIEKFFKLIVRLFKEPRSRWAANTLEFLTKCVVLSVLIYSINPLDFK
jgi:hypothetical protein